MLSAKLTKRNLQFSFPAGTSRGILTEKPTWYISVWKNDSPEVVGIGECSPIWGLSPEKKEQYEELLEQVVSEINDFDILLNETLLTYPSIYFGLETSMLDLFKGGKKIFFDNAFTLGLNGIKINGLVWMNSIEEMYKQAISKHKNGFKCIKIKIGALGIEDELSLLGELRKELGANTILRVDANGAFDFNTARELLPKLKSLNIHSIEQPIKAGLIEEMAQLCKLNQVAIALDEELIGYYKGFDKEKLIQTIKPHFIVLKPSLHGGFFGCRQWIDVATKYNCGWWMTSALESSIGLNAIAQYTFQTQNKAYHGLGTGKIYTNNIESPLTVKGEELIFDSNKSWESI